MQLSGTGAASTRHLSGAPWPPLAVCTGLKLEVPSWRGVSAEPGDSAAWKGVEPGVPAMVEND